MRLSSTLFIFGVASLSSCLESASAFVVQRQCQTTLTRTLSSTRLFAGFGGGGGGMAKKGGKKGKKAGGAPVKLKAKSQWDRCVL